MLISLPYQLIRFDEVDHGGVFEYKGPIYMRTVEKDCGPNAVNVSTGVLAHFDYDDYVHYYPLATLEFK